MERYLEQFSSLPSKIDCFKNILNIEADQDLFETLLGDFTTTNVIVTKGLFLSLGSGMLIVIINSRPYFDQPTGNLLLVKKSCVNFSLSFPTDDSGWDGKRCKI